MDKSSAFRGDFQLAMFDWQVLIEKNRYVIYVLSKLAKKSFWHFLAVSPNWNQSETPTCDLQFFNMGNRESPQSFDI